MDSLLKGISIAVAPGLPLIDNRILLSSGTIPWRTPEYDGDAFIPAEPWRKPSDHELNILCEGGYSLEKAHCAVAIVSVPETLTVALREDFTNPAPAESLLSFLNETYLIDPEVPVLVRGVKRNPPGLHTVTPNHEKKLLGIHLDHWDSNSTLYDRMKCRRKIVVNLGTESRRYLYINLTLQQMAEQVFRSELKGYGMLGYELMKRFPAYPVVSVEVKPSEAYIAPTENSFHEGTTIGRTEWDLNYSALGMYGLR